MLIVGAVIVIMTTLKLVELDTVGEVLRTALIVTEYVPAVQPDIYI